jgi:DNA-binding transcriptional MerR regulator
MPEDELLTSGDFSRRSRLSPKALRLYEQQGLLVPDEVDAANRYRRYRASRLADARLIVWLRRLDMPLADVASVLAAPATERDALVAAYWEQAEARFAAQRWLAARVREMVSGHEGGHTVSQNKQQSIHTRDVPARLVLTEQRHVTPEELPAWIGQATMRLLDAAGPAGGPAAEAFVVYHGEVNHDSDGPVEVCVPVDPAAADKLGTPTREEPAHREAYLRITKAQVAFPQILSAFDAVARWLTANDHVATLPPREVYFTDWHAAGPDDEVCDIAFPIQDGELGRWSRAGKRGRLRRGWPAASIKRPPTPHTSPPLAPPMPRRPLASPAAAQSRLARSLVPPPGLASPRRRSPWLCQPGL